MMTLRKRVYVAGVAGAAIGAGACSMPASTTEITKTSAPIAAATANDWTTYHGTYQLWHYSPLTQINTDNVKRLRGAWVHHPGKSTRGLPSMPLVSGGVLYYTGSYSRVWALEAATGKPLWSYFPKLNDDLVAAQT